MARHKGWIFSLTYLGLYLLAGVYAVVYCFIRQPAPEFNPVSLVTIPWTFIIIPWANSWGIQSLYQKFVHTPLLNGGLMTLVLLPGALLNAGLLYFIGKMWDK